MKTILNSPRENWDLLCKRPYHDNSNLEAEVRKILDKVKAEGDKALRDYSMKFDNVHLESIKVPESELDGSENMVSPELKNAIAIAAGNIEKFHKSQNISEPVVETVPGVRCWRKNTPVENVGLYIPGGSSPLFSTILMLAIPARLAGCKRVIMCSPPGRESKLDPLILFTAKYSGIKEVFMAGGAQAVAAMAYGTETIPKVSKIFGPGNQYVTKAKEIVQSQGIAIDIPAGPSEVLVIADKCADPQFIASDLLSQAEHGPDSQVVFLTDDSKLMKKVLAEVEKQLMILPRKEIAAISLSNSMAVLLPSIDDCISFSNKYAPEHLIINTSRPMALAEKVINAGSVFIGKYSCESAGDYASGTNHTLPTNGFAKSYSGVSMDSFVKKVTFQEIDHNGIRKLGPVIEVMAEAEQLIGHKNAVSIRLKLK
jgi:histidinol dehydrogenase